MRVVFMGTPDIAATCLNKILEDGFDVVGVFTQPDRPKGRGMKMVFSPVKEIAIAKGIPVFQPESFRADEDVQTLADLKPDVCAVVDGSCLSVYWISPPWAASIFMPVCCLSTGEVPLTSGQFWMV